MLIQPTFQRKSLHGQGVAPARRSLLILLRLAFFALLLYPASLPGAALQDRPAPIAWSAVENLLEHRAFQSKEELFQVLFLLSEQEHLHTFRLEKDTLSRLKKKITTLFPLAGCTAIERRDARLVFEFTEDQEVTIPNTLAQASLKMPKKLVFRISDKTPVLPMEKKDPGDRFIGFVVEEGYLHLHFSFLLRIFGGRLRDADGRELIYQINDSKKYSRLNLIELTRLGSESLQISWSQPESNEPKTLWIDILHPDFPGARDIGIAESEVVFLGTTVELLPDQMIRIGTMEPEKNEEAWNWFSNTFKSFRDYTQTGTLGASMEYTRCFGYYFEERQILMTMGFQSGDPAPVHGGADTAMQK